MAANTASKLGLERLIDVLKIEIHEMVPFFLVPHCSVSNCSSSGSHIPHKRGSIRSQNAHIFQKKLRDCFALHDLKMPHQEIFLDGVDGFIFMSSIGHKSSSRSFCGVDSEQ